MKAMLTQSLEFQGRISGLAVYSTQPMMVEPGLDSPLMKGIGRDVAWGLGRDVAWGQRGEREGTGDHVGVNDASCHECHRD
jgi:hypothetical protein